MLAAIFAKMNEKKHVLKGAQNAMKSAKTAMQSYEDFTGKKTVAKAYFNVGAHMLGFPQQLIRAQASAVKAANEAQKLRARSEAMAKAAELTAKRMPIPGKGGRGTFGVADVGAYKPADYIFYKGKNAEYAGKYLPPELYAKVKAAEPGPGRPKKVVETLKKAARKGKLKGPKKSMKRVLELD